jgi:hypothetical protein
MSKLDYPVWARKIYHTKGESIKHKYSKMARFNGYYLAWVVSLSLQYLCSVEGLGAKIKI